MDIRRSNPSGMRSMRRSISLEDLGLATDAPKLTSLLFAKALSFEGKEAMRALEAVRIAALEDEASPEGPESSCALERLAKAWGVDVAETVGFASEDRQVSADSRARARALLFFCPNLRICCCRARAARGRARSGTHARGPPRGRDARARAVRAADWRARRASPAGARESVVPHPARISRRPRLAPQSQQEWRRRSVFPPRHMNGAVRCGIDKVNVVIIQY